MRTLLIDCDSLVHEAASANEYAAQWDEDLWTLHANFDPARAQLDERVKELKEKLQADQVVMALSDYSDPWRKKILPTYKGNRKTRKPLLFKPLRDYVHEVYTTFQRPGLEGDDVLGILLTAKNPPVKMTGDRVVVSIDKDMNTLPGLHFRLDRPTHEDWVEDIREVTLEQANRYHMLQTLTGDQTDGYGGCPGVGPVSAEKVLGDAKTPERWPRVVAAYAKKGLGEEVALTMARVARICRAEDYNMKTREVILWNPAK